jgi:hypothetical protein
MIEIQYEGQILVRKKWRRVTLTLRGETKEEVFTDAAEQAEGSGQDYYRLRGLGNL